jgi:uncharacterized membrane protein YfcA
VLEQLGVADPGPGVYAALVVFAAYLIRGIAGFGSGLIAVPFLSLVAPVAVVVPLVVTLDYIGSAGQGTKNVGQVAWREQRLLIPFMIVGIGLGLLLLRATPPVVLARLLGGFVILFALSQWLPAPPFSGSRGLAAVGGVLGGLVGTLFGTGGPFYAIYLRLRDLDKAAFRATFATNFLIDGGIRLVAYVLMGLYGLTTLTAVALALPVAAVALFTGGRIHTGLSQADFMRLISLLLLGSGVALIVRG